MEADHARELLHRSGVLYQALSPQGGAICVDIRGDTVLLAPLAGKGCGEIPGTGAARFEVITPDGLLRVSGTLAEPRKIEINGVAQVVAALEVPPGGVGRVNRRAHHRVSVALQGSFSILPTGELQRAKSEPQGTDHREKETSRPPRAESRRPCTVRDLGLGGARLVTTPPAPKRGAPCDFDLALGPNQALSNLRGRIIECRPLPGTSPLLIEVRVRFEGLAPPSESLLSRYLTRQQLEMLRKGIRA